MVKLFVGAIGLAFVLLGTGIWRTNKLALQAVEPFLTFTLLSLGFVLIKDYVDGTRNFQVLKSSFYLALLATMLVFWVLKLRSTASRLAVPQNQVENK